MPVSRVIAALTAAACLSAAGCSGEAGAESRGRGGPPPAVVELGEVTEGALQVERTYVGQVRALARAELGVGASGEVREVMVRVGDRVEAGAVLLRLDPDLARAQLDAVTAARGQTDVQAGQAQREAERFQRAGARSVAAVEIERAESSAEAFGAQRRSLAAQVRQARETLDRHRVRAPFAGVIAARNVDEGDWVDTGAVVLELVADDRTEVLVRVDPQLLEDVEVGTALTLIRGERTAPGRVAGVVPALDPETRSAQLRAVSDAPTPWLLAGAAVDVRFVLAREGEGVVVPRDALVVGVAETRVVTVVEGQAQPVVVEVVQRGGDRVRVRGEGLAVGDPVVVRGNERLRPGQALRVEGE